jgi:hypothetical protein
MARSRMRFVVTAAVCVLAGCAAHTHSESNKASEYTGQPKRIDVIEMLGPGLPADQINDFNLSFGRSMGACRVGIAIVTMPQDIANAPSLTAAFLAGHKAEAVLTIGTSMTQMASGQLFLVQYLFSLTDVASGKPVWKALIALNWDTLLGDKSHLGQTLAAAAIQQMQKDQLVANCAGAP